MAPPSTDTWRPPGRPSRAPMSRSIGLPAKPATPYEPGAALRTMSSNAPRLASARPAAPVTVDSSDNGGIPRALPAADHSVGTASGLWYVTSPLRPNWPGVPVCWSISEESHGSFVRNLRQGFDGRFQPPVVGLEPGPRAPAHATEPAANRDRYPRRPDQDPGLHPLPPNPDENGPLGFLDSGSPAHAKATTS